VSSIPRDAAVDSTLALLSEGYTFVSTRARRYHCDVFRARVMLRPAFFALGAEAAQQFYEPGRFTRRHALPITTLKLLQDKGSVQLLDSAAHRRRKQMFLSLATPGSTQQLTDAFASAWRAQLPRWEGASEVVLFREVSEVLCRAVCAWAGVPLPEAEVQQRTREFLAMIDGAGGVGPRALYGLLVRSRTERWCRDVIEQVRSGRLNVPEDAPAHVIAHHRGLHGRPLDTHVAAVELLNVLRPSVAVGRFVTFAALALHMHPECVPKLNADEDYLDWFVQEVRRFYPFFPLVGGRVRRSFTWRGHDFVPGTWFLLDLYGTNHDPRIWQEPDAFRPERFREWGGDAFSFLPQGGGDHDTGHRCPGEWGTIALVKTAVRLLTTGLRYDVPQQDLRIDLSRMPALPRSGVVLTDVRQVG
jgi:fatty-acid peroxygenase